MAKATVQIDQPKYCRSAFTLTFAIEILGIEVWHDCNEGWLDLGPHSQAMKIQYQLYPGQTFDVDILIWPHAAKIWRGPDYGWVRTWQFLERRFLTFSIRHAFPVRVADLCNFIATVTPTIGIGNLSANAKNDRNFEVFLPPLKFGERRYFAPIVELEETIEKFFERLIWSCIVEYIPISCFDGAFDVPLSVTDLRHQDASLLHVKEVILSRNLLEEIEEVQYEEVPNLNKTVKEKKKAQDTQKVKFEIKLSGHAILAANSHDKDRCENKIIELAVGIFNYLLNIGTGRVIPFEVIGDRPAELGDIIVLISSNNLPAHDDLPVLFVNIDSVFDIPVEEFKKLRITHLYTRWMLGHEKHESQQQALTSKKVIKFNDHHAIPLPVASASELTASFLDKPFEIELRAIRMPPLNRRNQMFFGYEKSDREFGKTIPPKQTNEDVDILVAVTKITDGQLIAKGINTFIKGEYSLYPPKVSFVGISREFMSTNDVNAVRLPVKPKLIVQPYTILLAHMTLETSFGLVGCRPKCLVNSFSRIFLLCSNTDITMKILQEILSINDEVAPTANKQNLLSGFAIDTGTTVIMYIEGPKDGYILRVWNMTADFYPDVKPVFSSSARYSTRIYAELLETAMPFWILKMYAPLGALLACPAVYARPALPLPTRATVLKIGRLIASKLTVAPNRSKMPTTAELRSFRLELCTPYRPSSLFLPEKNPTNLQSGKLHHPVVTRSSIKINWEKT